MNYTIEQKSGVPAYLQLYAQLRADIVAGAYPAGARLPSKRLLAGELGVGLVTAAHAYELLCEEGYAEPRERSGFYVLYRDTGCFNPAPAAPRRADAPPPPPEDFPFSVLAKTMRRVLSDYGERLLANSPHNGCLELREALAAYLLRSRGIRADAARLVVGSGAEYLYGLIAQLLGRGTRIALEDPCYEKIGRVYEACGARCQALEMGPEGILSPALSGLDAEALHVTPFHSYPSGVTASASKRQEYILWARRRGALIVEDDFDSEFTLSSKAEDTLYALEGGERVIYMNTFSRTIAPAIRIGYMLLPGPLMAEFERRLGFYSCTVPVFEQYVLAEFIQSGDFERHINRVRRRKRRAARESQGGESSV